MGYAVFPKRVGGGRIIVNAASVLLEEQGAQNGTGQALLWVPGLPESVNPILCSEDVITVYSRLAAALPINGIVGL